VGPQTEDEEVSELDEDSKGITQETHNDVQTSVDSLEKDGQGEGKNLPGNKTNGEWK